MKIIIAEDEILATERIQILLKQYEKKHNTDIEIIANFDTIEDTVVFLQNNAAPDLLLLDIQLADGHSFEIFEKVAVPFSTSIIFITAYDEYALKAFKFNSIDYLLKPVSFDDLAQALNKHKAIKEQNQQQNQSENSEQNTEIKQNTTDLATFARILKESFSENTFVNITNATTFKSRFLVKYGDKMQYQNVENIAYFYTNDKAIFLTTAQNKRFVIEHTLENLEILLDPTLFFRINRKMIVNINAIKEFKNHVNSRLKLVLEPFPPLEAVVSREKVLLFKQWIDK